MAHPRGAVGVLDARTGYQLLGRARSLTIPFMHDLMGFGWNGIMSAMNGASDAEEKPLRLGRGAKRGEGHAAVAAAVPAERAAARAAESATAAAAEDCLADERCVRALSAASSDALAVAAVATAGKTFDDVWRGVRRDG